jgi:hypothetical protein
MGCGSGRLFKREQSSGVNVCSLCLDTLDPGEVNHMSTNTLLIIIVLVLLFGGGGFYFRR